MNENERERDERGQFTDENKKREHQHGGMSPENDARNRAGQRAEISKDRKKDSTVQHGEKRDRNSSDRDQQR